MSQVYQYQSKGIKAADDLMRKLVKVPKSEVSAPTPRKKSAKKKQK